MSAGEAQRGSRQGAPSGSGAGGRRALRASGSQRASEGAEGSAAQAPTPAQWRGEDAQAWLAIPSAEDDKYRRGVLAVRTGSHAYPGAAVLGVSSAWRTGIGMVRYVPAHDPLPPAHGLPTPAAAVLAAHPETVFGEPGGASSSAWLLGSGTDPGARTAEERDALLAILRGDAPVVIDAGALDLALEPDLTAPRILTPHRGEFARLWQAAGLGDRPTGWPARTRRDRAPRRGALVEAAARLAERLGAAVLLKGSLTVCATPGGQVSIAGPATPWLATAGTGDVLAGALGSLVAAHDAAVREDPELLGAIGASAAVLHDTAARIAAGDAVPPAASAQRGAAQPATAGAPITAGDTAAALPRAVELLRSLPPRAKRGR